MWNKIYLIILAAAILAMGVLLYLPFSWLQSIGAPATVRDNYLYYSNISWMFLLVSGLILLIAGNVVLWKTRRSWAMWTTLLYFAVFMVAQTFWLENSFFRFKQENNFASGAVSWSPISGAVLIALAAVIVFFNQYLVKRLLDRTHPPTQPVESLPEEISANEKNT
jgi:uncharacterized membrane protein